MFFNLTTSIGSCEGVSGSKVISIKSQLFFERLNLICTSTETTISEQVYNLKMNAKGIKQLSLSIYPFEKSAENAFHKIIMVMAIAPTNVSDKVGEDMKVWSGKSGGTLFFRRMNVVVSFTWSGNLYDGLDYALIIDKIIVDDHDVAPKGAATSEPNEFGFIRPDDSGLKNVIIRPLYIPPGYSANGAVLDEDSKSKEGLDPHEGGPGSSHELEDGRMARDTARKEMEDEEKRPEFDGIFRNYWILIVAAALACGSAAAAWLFLRRRKR